MSEVEVRKDMVYGRGGGRELKCDVYSPRERSGRAPAILLVHGGAWRMGSRDVMQGFGERFAAAGFVGIAPEYRLTPESAWPAQIEDVKATIRWTRAQHDALGIDPEQITILGRSAGAHLALMAGGAPGVPEFAGNGGNAGASEAVAAVVAIFPPTVFYMGDVRTHGGNAATALLGDAATEELARAASPVTYAAPSFPPALLLHGSADKVVPPSASLVMYEALVKAGVPVELHMYAEQPHGFAGQPEFIDQIAAESIHFLRRYVGVQRPAEAVPA